MSKTKKSVLLSFIEFFVLAAVIVAIPHIVAVDALVLGNGVSEESLTELSQQVLILFSALLFGAGSIRCPRSRSFFVLVSAFFTCMFIREGDVYLDQISHGFWVYPVAVVAISAIAYAWRNNTSLWYSISRYVETRSYYFVLVGLLTVLVFSRTFGSGSLLWGDLMGGSYDIVYKSAIQEGLELFGYLFVFYGSFLFLRNVQENHCY